MLQTFVASRHLAKYFAKVLNWKSYFARIIMQILFVNTKNKVKLVGHAFRKSKRIIYRSTCSCSFFDRVFVVHNICWSLACNTLIPWNSCNINFNFFPDIRLLRFTFSISIVIFFTKLYQYRIIISNYKWNLFHFSTL